jgi:uncharacterized protein (DUF2336 family)
MLSRSCEGRKVDRALLRTIVEQFVARTGYRQTDLQEFGRLAGGLIDLAETDAVADVAEALCLHPETPRELIAKLFDLGGACARIALEHAPDAPLAELIAYAEHGSPDFAAAIARRPDLSRDVVSALAARSESAVLHALAANRQAYLDPGALRSLIQVARDDQGLARILLDREDLDVDPEPLFLAATTAEREKIILAACRSALSSGVVEPAARPDHRLGSELEALALSGDEGATISRMADALDARKSRIRKIFVDEGGEALALALVALGIHPDIATRLFICHRRAAALDAKKMRALRALMTSTPARAAARIVAAINGNRDPQRRVAGWREEASGPTGVRRRTAIGLKTPAEGRKPTRLDQSA